MAASRSHDGGGQAPPYPITVTAWGLVDIERKHTPEGPDSVDRGIFWVPEATDLRQFVEALVGPAEYAPPEYQPRHDTFARVVQTDDFIGEDEFGNPENEYTVITTAGPNPGDPHELLNAFPGRP
jgi:hypothetical protein